MRIQVNHNLYDRIRNGVSVARYGAFKKFVSEKTGITIRAFYYIAKGKIVKPDITVLQAVSEWFGCTLEEVLDPNFPLVDKGIKCKTAPVSSTEEEMARLYDLNKEAA